MTIDLLLQASWFAAVLLACWGYAKWLFGDASYPLPTGFCIFAIIFTGLRWAHLEAAAATVCFAAFCIAGWTLASIYLIRIPGERPSVIKHLAAFVAIYTFGYLVPMSGAVDQRHYAMDMAWFFSPEWVAKQAVSMSAFAPKLWDLASLTRPATTLLGWTSNLISVSIDYGVPFRLALVLLVYLGYLLWTYLAGAKTAIRVAVVAAAISGNLIFSLLFLGQLGQAFGSVFLLLLFLLVASGAPTGRELSHNVQLSLIACTFVLSYPEMCLLLPFAVGASVLTGPNSLASRRVLLNVGAVAVGTGTPLSIRLPRYVEFLRGQASTGATASPNFPQFAKSVVYYWGMFLAGTESSYITVGLLIAIGAFWTARFVGLTREGKLRLGLAIVWFAAYTGVAILFVGPAKNPPYVLFKLACWIGPFIPIMLYATLGGVHEDSSRARSVLQSCATAVLLALGGIAVYAALGRLEMISSGTRQPPVVLVTKTARDGVKVSDDDAGFYSMEWARLLLPYKNAPLSLAERPRWGRVYSFTATGNGKEIELAGWSAPEQWHTWTASDRAVLRIPLPPVQADVYLGMACNAYINAPAVPLQKILIRANGEQVDDFETRAYFRRVVKIPQSIAAEGKNLDVSFLLPDATKAPDGRELAIGCNYMVLDQGKPPTLW